MPIDASIGERTAERAAPRPASRRDGDARAGAFGVGRAALWRPRHLDGARQVGQLPYLFWLMETRRPGLVVQLGLSEAQGFLAFCQAADHLGLPARCRAVGRPGEAGTSTAWRVVADEHAGLAEVSEGAPAEALAGFDDGSIDLLAIDAGLPEEDLAALAHAAWDKVSPSGLVVMLGMEPGEAGRPAAEALRRLKGARPSLALRDGAAVRAEAVLAGAQGGGASAAGRDAPEADLALAILARLGEGVAHRWRADAASAELAEVRGRLEAEIAELTKARDERHEACARAQALLFDERRERERVEAEVAAARAASSELARVRSALRAAERSVALRFQETAALSAALIELEGGRRGHRGRGGELAQLRSELAEVRAERDVVLGSTFWRMTAPARRLVDGVRGLRGRLRR